MTTREGTPTARHMAAVRTECSVQSPVRLRATSPAAANATLKFLSRIFWATHRLIGAGLLPRVFDAAGDPRGQAADPDVVAVDEGVGLEELGVDLAGHGLAVDRAGGLDLQDRRIRLGSTSGWIDWRESPGEDLGDLGTLELDPILHVPRLLGVGDLPGDLDDRGEDQVELDGPRRRQRGLLGRPVVHQAAHDVLLRLEDLSLRVDVDAAVQLRPPLAVDRRLVVDPQERTFLAVAEEDRLERPGLEGHVERSGSARA